MEHRTARHVAWLGLVLAPSTFLAIPLGILLLDDYLWTSKAGWWIWVPGAEVEVGRAWPASPEYDPAFPWRIGGNPSKLDWWSYGGKPPPAFSISLLWLYLVPLAFAILTAFGFASERKLRRRLARNQCSRCGYDRAGLVDGAACPECGTLTSPTTSPPTSPD
jgi:hypothetical protein